jgi:hypothetical protein
MDFSAPFLSRLIPNNTFDRENSVQTKPERRKSKKEELQIIRITSEFWGDE